jgi:hypothetical protein
MPVTRLCLVCHAPFTRKPSDFLNDNGKYCSKACYGHATSQRASADLAARFWSRVNKTDTCWLWTGYVQAYGYGTLIIDKRMQMAHRVSYEMAYGPILPGLFCLHHCDTPACVRPDHLFLGTQGDNMRDMVSKNRHFAVTHPERQARGDQSGPRLHPERMARGEQHVRAKLTEAQVREIRQLHATGQWSYGRLCIHFGVHKTTIALIIQRKNWKHLL